MKLLPAVVRSGLGAGASGASGWPRPRNSFGRPTTSWSSGSGSARRNWPRPTAGLRVEMEERRRAEEQVQQHQAELAHVARLSTVGEMVAELAHELNQPLSAISSYAQACKRLLQRGDGDRVEELSAALNQVERADRPGGGDRSPSAAFCHEGQARASGFGLCAVIRDVAELMNIDARTAKADVALELAEPLPPIVGDRIQLEQVLVNLMRNGFEALRESDAGPSAADRPHGGRRPAGTGYRRRGGQRRRHSARSGRSSLRSIFHHQARRHGHGLVDQPIDHRESRGNLWIAPDFRAWRGVSFHLAD